MRLPISIQIYSHLFGCLEFIYRYRCCCCWFYYHYFLLWIFVLTLGNFNRFLALEITRLPFCKCFHTHTQTYLRLNTVFTLWVMCRTKSDRFKEIMFIEWHDPSMNPIANLHYSPFNFRIMRFVRTYSGNKHDYFWGHFYRFQIEFFVVAKITH